MKNLLIIITLALFTVACTKTHEEKPYNRGINITPIPLELTEGTGEFILNKNVVFVSSDDQLNKVAAYFAAKIKNSTGYNLKTVIETPKDNFINLNIVETIPVNDEGYLLEVTDKGIHIQAKTPQGAFYGMQTVMQLLPAEIESPTLIKDVNWKMPAVTIKDEPRFKYRGQHLDVCRHFSDVDFIKKQLDVLAMFKINTFHWHLTEDQGWRIEIKKYPRLTEISAQRIEGEGHVYGPYFYTHEQVKEVVAYAKERFIEVIPEIELPGHGVAALAAYPELSCTGGPFEVRNVWGVSNDIYCAGNEETFQFFEDVIAEVVPLFESEYFHIGGDEAPKGRWKNCPKCQARIKAENLKANKEHSAEEMLQSYFVQRIEKVLTQHGKKMIGWDEILEGGLAATATVMSWRGESGGIAAGNMGHDVIMTPHPWLYLDSFQQDEKVSPTGIGSFTPLAKTYSYDPIPEKLDESKKHHILGVQGNVWTEYMYSPELIEYYTYPRILALSEIAWSALERKDYKDFERRLENQRARLDMHQIAYFIPVPEDRDRASYDFVAFTNTAVLDLRTAEPVTIVYTLDGSEPNAQSAVFEKPLHFTENTTVKTRSIVLSGRMSRVRTIEFEKQTFAPAVAQTDLKPGFKAEYYKGVMHTVSQLEGKTPDETGWVATPREAKYRVRDYRELYPEDYYNTVLDGYIEIIENGVYFISTNATELWINGKLFISSEGQVTKQTSNRSIALAKGYHSVKLVRLSGIVGGWPPLWESIQLKMEN